MSNINSAAICLTLACALTIPAHATTIIVSNTNDNGPGSLRQALATANDGDTIDATGISGVITLTSGQLLVDKSVTINGSATELLAVDGNAISRVFEIVGGAKTVSISGLTIRNGQGGNGGGIENAATVTLTIVNSTLSGNVAGLGGGVFNSGTLTIINSTFSNNMASQGGGIYNPGSGMLTISNSTLSDNAAPVAGGASFNVGTLQIANTTLSDNSSPLGGGVFNIGALQIGNTILNAGASGANIANNGGTVTSHGYNVSSDNGGGFLNGTGDQINTNPMLGPLQNNGGPTSTHALLPGSPAIDAGDPKFTPPPFFDQRGPVFWRLRNNRIDVGSFEVQSGTTPSPTPTPTLSPTPTPTATFTPTATVPPSPTPTPSVCFVYITDPDCGSVINTPPVDFTVFLSDPTDPSSVQPTDFTVNKTPADSFTFENFAIVFHFNTSPAVQGLNVMHIPACAFKCSIGCTPEFTCTFTYQPSTPTPTPTPTPAPRSTPVPRSRPTPRLRP